MKLLIIALALLTISSAFADSCKKKGKELLEQSVREEVQMRFGNNIKIEAVTTSLVSNIYTSQMLCHHETLYTFSAYDQASGAVKRFVGKSIMNNSGSRPMPSTLEVVKDL